MTSTSDFISLPWHDAELRELTIDRRIPGTHDRVTMSIVWPNAENSVITFYNCYALIAEMNFGVIARETILSASILLQDPHLSTICQQWSQSGADLRSVKCFRIETASTASVIKIYSELFEIE